MFNVGDTVTLKSGGPRMTVTAVDYMQHLICTWFGPNQELRTGTFPSAALVASSDDD
ncbi:YodC family protein [Vibrio cholerae]|uniref:YodC family protein n=1 Tax=Vibrio cholerae TaxID=666 RepID=UPI003D34F83E